MSPQPRRLADLSGGRACAAPLARAAEWALGLDAVNGCYGRIGGRGLGVGAFSEAALQDLGVSVDIQPQDLERLRGVRGPCLVLANHPLGGRDALALLHLLSQARSDFRLMANRLLGAIPEVAPSLILVDPFGRQGSAAFNLGPMRQARQWLSQGGLLGLFPAGEVSLWQGQEGRVADKAWSSQAVRLARASGATLLPLHISGATSHWLQALARVHPLLKTPFLAREMMHGPARALRLTLGRPLPASALPHPQDPGAAAAWMRRQAYLLDPLPALRA